MALIGEFEAAVKEADPDREPDQFRLNGQVFTVSDEDLTVPLGMFARAARGGTEADEMEGLAAMIDLLEAVVVPDDRARLLAAARGISPETLWSIVVAVVEAQSGRPTAPPSVSSAGRSTTGVNSRALSPFGAVPPILQDPRVQALQPVNEAGLSLVG